MSAKTAKSAANDMLDKFRLSDRAKAPVLALSGGMAQRLMVARAIMHRPSILFLDEPTAGLDPQSRIALWEILGDLHAQGQTILLTTHYMEEADQLCDRVAIMDHGRILALDTPAKLKAGVDVDSVVTLSSDGDLDALAKVLASDVPGVERVDIADGALRVAIGTAPGIVPALVTAADRNGFRVTDLSVTEVTLETVFINLTGKDLRD
jgi:ABC-2 type transport system ATP-binding protein